MFLRNAWNVAALTHEPGEKSLQRWILGEALALYRTAAGRGASCGTPRNSSSHQVDVVILHVMQGLFERRHRPRLEESRSGRVLQ